MSVPIGRSSARIKAPYPAEILRLRLRNSPYFSTEAGELITGVSRFGVPLRCSSTLCDGPTASVAYPSHPILDDLERPGIFACIERRRYPYVQGVYSVRAFPKHIRQSHCTAQDAVEKEHT